MEDWNNLCHKHAGLFFNIFGYGGLLEWKKVPNKTDIFILEVKDRSDYAHCKMYWENWGHRAHLLLRANHLTRL